MRTTPHPRTVDARLGALEARVEETAADAAARDRDLADLGTEADANRRAVNALGTQTRARFAEGHAGFAAGQERIVALLTTLIGES